MHPSRSHPGTPLPTARGSVPALLLALSLALQPAHLVAQSGILFVRVNGPEGPVANALVEVLYGEDVLRTTGTDENGAARSVENRFLFAAGRHCGARANEGVAG